MLNRISDSKKNTSQEGGGGYLQNIHNNDNGNRYQMNNNSNTTSQNQILNKNINPNNNYSSAVKTNNYLQNKTNSNSQIITAMNQSTKMFNNNINSNSNNKMSNISSEFNGKTYVHSNRKLVTNSTQASQGIANSNSLGQPINNYNNNLQISMNQGGGQLLYSPTSINEINLSPLISNPHNLLNNNNIHHNSISSNSNFPFQYQSNKNSSILKMGELIDYLLGKGYVRDACDSFLDYVYQVQDLPFNQLLCDEFCEGSEELQLKESVILYKLSTKFSAYLISQTATNNHGGDGRLNSDFNQANTIDIDNAYIILQFINKIILSAQNKQDDILIMKWKANYYSNLGIYYIKRQDYMLAINYFNLSLQMFSCMQAMIQQKISDQENNTINMKQTTMNGLATLREDNVINKDEQNNEIDEDIPINDEYNNNNNNNNNQAKQQQNAKSIYYSKSNIFTSGGENTILNQMFDSTGWAIQESIVLNNLAVLHGMMGDLDRAEELLIQSVSQSENEIFQQIKKVSTQYLRKDKQFLEKLPVLIYGYIFCEGVKKRKQIRLEQSKFLSQDAANQQQPHRSFLKNAYSLSRKFFGEDNPFTLKIDIFRRRFSMHNQHADILAETFPFEIDMKKLSNASTFLLHQKNEWSLVNQYLGNIDMNGSSQQQLSNRNTNTTGSFIHQQRIASSTLLSRRPKGFNTIEDITDEKTDQLLNQNQDGQNNKSHRKGRNKSMHQISSNSNLYNTFGRPIPFSPAVGPISFQQQQNGWIARNQQQRSQNQFRIQQQQLLQGNYKISNQNNKGQNGTQQNSSKKNNTNTEENKSQSMQEEIRVLKQSLALVETQLKQINSAQILKINTNQLTTGSNNDNTDFNIYKKDAKKIINNGINNTEFSSQIINSQLDNNINSNNGGIISGTDLSNNQTYSINTNTENTFNQNINRVSKRVISNQNINNSIRDERSNSNGSIKPSQFKKESKQGNGIGSGQSILQHQTSNEHHENIIPSKKSKSIIEDEQDTSRFPVQSNKQFHETDKYSNNNGGSNPYLQQIYNSEDNKYNQQNNINNNQQRYQTPIQSSQNNQQENGFINGSGGGSFSQIKQPLKIQTKSQQPQYPEIDRQNPQNIDKYESQFKNGIKQQLQLPDSTIKDSQKLIKSNQVYLKDIKIKKYGSDEKQEPDPKIASLLQQQQNYQISKITETIVKNLQVDQVFILKKRINLKDTNESYVVKCGVLYNKVEKCYKISISSYINQSNTAAKVEEIELSILTNLLCFVSFQDVLPSTMNLDSINSLYDVCKYFILPFVGLSNKPSEKVSTQNNNNNSVQSNEFESKTIMVYPRAHGILSEYHKTLFLEQNVLIQFNYIEGFQFRIVICDKETNKKNLRIDVEYDEGSFNSLYTTTEKDEYCAQKLEDYFESTHESEISQQGIELVHRDIEISGLKNIQQRRQKTKTEEYFIQSLKISSFTQFQSHFTLIIKEFERIIKSFSLHKNLESVCQDLSHFRFRVYQGLKKSMAIIVTDTSNKFFPPLINNPTPQTQQQINSNGVRVLLFNNFDSYGPQGVKIKEKGEQTLNPKEIKKMYGLNYNSLQNEQKLILFSLCSYHFNLRVVEKLTDQVKSNLKSEVNNIIRIPNVSGGESTLMLNGSDSYNYPIVFEIVGSKDTFLGIKITIYNPASCDEQGIFLTTNHSSWLFQNEILKKKMHHFCVDSLPLSNYFITHIFKKIAVPILLANMFIENIQTPVLRKQVSASSVVSLSTPFDSSISKPTAELQKQYKVNTPRLLGTKGLITDNCIILRLETLLDPSQILNYFLPSNKQR